MHVNGRKTAMAGVLAGTLVLCGCAGQPLSPLEKAQRERERELYLACLHEQAPALRAGSSLAAQIRASCRAQARRGVATARR